MSVESSQAKLWVLGPGAVMDAVGWKRNPRQRWQWQVDESCQYL